MLDNNIEDRIKKIKFLVSDVDGVLTDGKIYISSNGIESKTFCVEDGTGVAIAKCAGLDIAFISGRFSKSTEIRANELRIKYCIQGHLNKKNKLYELIDKLKIKPHQVAYIGDGLVDIPVLKIVGLPISVPNGHKDVQKYSLYVTKKNGGDGVLQEVVELILKVQGSYVKTIQTMSKKVF